jgi:hypothetical protein
MARDAMEAQDVSSLRQQVAELRELVKSPVPKHGKLHTSREAWTYIAVSERTFRDIIGAELIRPENPDALNGEHYRFTKVVLDAYLTLPSGTVRTALAMYRRRKKRTRTEGRVASATGTSPPA